MRHSIPKICTSSLNKWTNFGSWKSSLHFADVPSSGWTFFNNQITSLFRVHAVLINTSLRPLSPYHATPHYLLPQTPLTTIIRAVASVQGAETVKIKETTLSTYVWYCACKKLNSSLILSSVSAIVNLICPPWGGGPWKNFFAFIKWS